MQKQILELKEAKSQVTDVDALRLDLRQFCAELQQKVEMGLEVERQVSMRVAPLQQELDAVKVELQQSQPDVSNLETKVQRIEQATMQQAYQTNRAARQLRAKNAVLPNFCQAEHETPQSLKRAVSQCVGNTRLQTDAVVAKATRFSRERVMLVQVLSLWSLGVWLRRKRSSGLEESLQVAMLAWMMI